jgi:hypothetical protein
VPSHHGRRRAVCLASPVQPVSLGDAQGRSEAIGAISATGELAAGELWPVKVVATMVSTGAKVDQWGQDVRGSRREKMIFFFFRKYFLMPKLV